MGTSPPHLNSTVSLLWELKCSGKDRNQKEK